MKFSIAGKFSLLCTLAALLSEYTVDAQNFVLPSTETRDKYGNRSQTVEFSWAYIAPDLSKVSFTCNVGKDVIIYKGESARATVDGKYTGRVVAIDDTTSNPKIIGFRLRNVDFSDVKDYYCLMIISGKKPEYSQSFSLKIYERPFFISCLQDGISTDSTGASFFALVKGMTLNSTCMVYGNPVPQLRCTTYDKDNRQVFALTPTRRNYTAYPIRNRMLFYGVGSEVTKVRCVADGGPTGWLAMEQAVRVDYKPSKPYDIRLVRSTLNYIEVTWKTPVSKGLSPITRYNMALRHPNSTVTYTNYTVLSVNPILQYTFQNLKGRQIYRISIAAYNAVGRGDFSNEEKFETVLKSGTGARTGESGMGTGAIVGIVFGVFCAIILILIIVFFVLKKRREKAGYPSAYVEEAVDYPPSDNPMYSHVNKKRAYKAGGDKSTSGYPDLIHQAKPAVAKKANSPSNRGRGSPRSGYERSRKEYV